MFRNLGDLSCLGSSVINEQALVSSLHEKEELIEVYFLMPFAPTLKCEIWYK